MKEGDLVAQYLKIDEEGDYVARQKPCPFLAEDNTCNIYDDRPSDCARYPYTDEDVFLKRTQLTLKNTLVCPIAFTVIEGLLKVK
jgi:Fe-S-cluster containining protein